jgi:hypothetical protein
MADVQYGEIDGEISNDYAICFSGINRTLINSQKERLKKLRELNVFPQGSYLFSDPIDLPQNLDCNNLLN